MKNLKFLSFVLLFGVLVIAGCEKTNNPEKVSCEGDDVCPVEANVGDSSIEIEETPSVVIESNDEEGELNGDGGISIEDGGNSEGDLDSYNDNTAELSQDFESAKVESSSEPVLRVMVDEDSDSDGFEITPSQTCEALGGIWDEGDCTLQDGSKVYF